MDRTLVRHSQQSARERRLPQLQKLGVEVPVPLRSETQPDQLDGLGGHKQNQG